MLRLLVLLSASLCSPADRDFDRVDYPAQVALCRRHVPRSVRLLVLRRHGLTLAQGQAYELDHRVPLCAGGSNSPVNLWPEPWDDAHRKDVLEARVCRGLRTGRLTLGEALQLLGGLHAD